jgi:mannose-6-phosphate isomerase
MRLVHAYTLAMAVCVAIRGNVSYPLRFMRMAVPKPWAGTRLHGLFPELPAGTGESIELADLPGQSSVIANGEWRGQTIRQAVGAVTGDVPADLPDFPLAVKLLDTAEVLSVQDHPSDEFADGRLVRRGKSECWIVLEAEPESVIYQGLKPGVTRERFEASLTGGHPLSLMNAREMQRGDYLYNEAGMVHAIGAGLTLLEVQQNCGTTYRLWDLPRGARREMHVEAGLLAAKFDLQLPPIQKCKGDVLLQPDGAFGIRSLHVKKAFAEAKRHAGFTIVTCLEGPCDITARARDNIQPVRFSAGDTVLFPSEFDQFEYYPSGWLILAWARG